MTKSSTSYRGVAGHGRAVAAVVTLVLVLLVAGSRPAHAMPIDEGAVEWEVSAAGAVLWDPLDQRVLWERQAGEPRRIASLTKIMTALLALEAGAIDDTVTVSATANAADDRPGAATLGLRTGERMPMRSLLAGLLLRSGNDAAVAIAEHVAGTEEAFVAHMNARAGELDLGATRFVNASGLTNDADQRASPLDLIRLTQRAMRFDVFAELVGTATLDDERLGRLHSRNLLLDSYEGATGVKTGYTALAGRCLVATARRHGRTLYAVVLNSADSFADTAALLDYGFDAFTIVNLAAHGPDVYRMADGVVELQAPDAPAHTVAVDARVDVRVRLNPTPPADVAKGTMLGTMELISDGRRIDAAPIVARTALDREDPVTPDAAAGGAIEDAVRAFVRATPQRRPAL